METKNTEKASGGQDIIEKVRNAKGYEDMIDIYKHWNTYDQDNLAKGYKGPNICAKYIKTYATQDNLDSRCKILDACAGTGLVAKQLRDLGYTNIDGHDGSQEMLDIGAKLSRFNNICCAKIGDASVLPIEDNTYDIVGMCGAFANGHIKCDAFLELFRIVKPGGLIVNTTRRNVITTIEEYQQLPQLIESWSKSGLIDILEITFPDEKYDTDNYPIVHVFRVL